jgi:hypothetical protein
MDGRQFGSQSHRFCAHHVFCNFKLTEFHGVLLLPTFSPTPSLLETSAFSS